MWRLHCVLVSVMFTACMSHGMLLPEQKFESRYLGGSRTVRVYLPPSYAGGGGHYPVLYLHDGENVFSSAGSNCCFGWGGWEIDRAVDSLCAEGRMQEIIIVAVDNNRSRYKEYRGLLHPNAGPKGSPRSSTNALDNTCFQAYANFLIKELKPKIDHEYRTLKGAANTAVMGSSLGGICSLSLAWEFPKVFGAAASLSGSFHIEKRNFLEQVLRLSHRKPKPVRVYLDSGTIDYTGDDDGRKETDAVAAELRRIGWKEGINLNHFTDLKPLTAAELEKAGLRREKWREAETSQHNEFYWRLRVWRPLVFLFPPKD